MDAVSAKLTVVACSSETKQIQSSSLSSKRSYFPINELDDSLLIEILHRIPCNKSIIRCKAVSKCWFTLISSPHFCRHCLLHQNDHPTLSKPFTLIIHYYYLEGLLHSELKTLITSREPIFKWPGFNFTYLPCGKAREGESIKVVASFNDLLLCSPSWYDNSTYYICNPLTAQWVALPPPPEKDDHKLVKIHIGFIFDYPYVTKNREEDCANTECWFRVVRIPSHTEGPLTAEVFSSETGTWNASVVSCVNHRLKGSVVAYNGMLHWLTSSGSIIAYDPYNMGKCCLIDCSIVNRREDLHENVRGCLGVCQASLRIVNCVTFRNCDPHNHLDYLSIWELKDYKTGRWSLEHKIYFNQMVSEDSRVQNYAYGGLHSSNPIAQHQNDKDIVYLKFFDYYVSCNVRTRELEVAGVTPGVTPYIHWSFYADNVFPLMLPWLPTPLPNAFEID